MPHPASIRVPRQRGLCRHFVDATVAEKFHRPRGRCSTSSLRREGKKMVTIKDKVRSFIVDNFLFGDTSYQLADTDSLIENDIIDSTAVLELVAFIEDDFGIAMVDSDVVPANLDSIERLSSFISARAKALAA